MSLGAIRPKTSRDCQGSTLREARKQHTRRLARERQRRRRARIREELFAQLGERCAECGSTENLTIDHASAAGAGWERRGVWSNMRNLRYLEELRAGVPLRTLCYSCNSRDGSRRRHMGTGPDPMEAGNVPAF